MNTRSTVLFLRFALGLVLLCSLALGSASPVSAAGVRCYVKANATGLNNGTTWANAYRSLQSALNTAICTEIWMAKGTYKPSQRTSPTDPRSATFQLKNAVAIYGGFAGNETLLSQRNPAANATILSGNIGAAGDADNSYHVVVGSGTNSTALLDGFTITAGNADQVGGGMYSISGSPTLKNIVFSANLAAYGGGAMFNSRSSPILTYVTFSGNRAATHGGAMFNTFSSPILTYVIFSGNSTEFVGGAMLNENSSSPRLTNVIFSNNYLTGPGLGGFGAGMNNKDGSNPILMNVTFAGNAATIGSGGGMANQRSSPRLTNVTFQGNSASTFTDGGGMDNYDSSPVLINVTFSQNTQGAMDNLGDSHPVIKNSIFFGDTEGEILLNDGASASVSYSIIQGGYAGTGNVDADPLLGPLQDNGGFTQTMALGSGSPAIDKGTNTGCPAKDQRGVARPQGPRCDMGAYEYMQKKLSLSSMGVEDGWLLESTETSNQGGSMNATGTVLVTGDDVLNKQYRSILSFNTGGLPDTAVITSVTVRFGNGGVVGTSPFTTHGNLLADVRTGEFSGNSLLELQDFQALASKNAVMAITNNPVNGWYTKALGPAGFAYINKAGITQFRLRFTKDDNDDLGADYIKFYSGNYGTAAYRPLLVITYYTP